MKRERGASNHYIISYVMVFLITAMLFAGLILFLLVPKAEFSENENRYLASFPQFSWDSLTEGDYLEDLQTYVNEHFPARDFFLGLKTGFEKICGKIEINGIYVSDDGYYIEKYREPENTTRIINRFSNLAEKLEHADLTLMLVPTAVTIYEEKLPKYAVNADQMAVLKEIYAGVACNQIDVYDTLIANRDKYQLYYRYDHHWTSYGAYLAYEEFCRAKGFSYTPLQELDAEAVSSDFKGTVYSKVNDYTVEGEEITIFRQPEQKLTVSFDRKAPVTGGTECLYNTEYLTKKDQYSYFLDNIHSYIEITNDAAAADREIVVIKDSYANCFVPFLANQYRKVYVFDTRYYRKSVSEFVNENPDVTDVLVLYNMNTIDSDLGIGGIY